MSATVIGNIQSKLDTLRSKVPHQFIFIVCSCTGSFIAVRNCVVKNEFFISTLRPDKKEASGLPSNFYNSKDILTICGIEIHRTKLNVILKLYPLHLIF